MTPKNRARLADRVSKAAETALAAQHYVSPLDVLVGIGWLDPGTVKRWQQGQIDSLEEAIQTNPARISEAMKLIRFWVAGKGLVATETDYSRARGSERDCASARAGTRRSRNSTEPTGSRPSFPSGSASAWRKKQPVHRIWW